MKKHQMVKIYIMFWKEPFGGKNFDFQPKDYLNPLLVVENGKKAVRLLEEMMRE